MILPDTEKLLLFRLPEEQPAQRLLNALKSGSSPAPALHEILNTACRSGWQGNLWHCLLTRTLLESENAFSLACERRQPEQDSLYALAQLDMAVYYELFRMEPSEPAWNLLCHFQHASETKASGEAVCSLAAALAGAPGPAEMLALLADFFARNGLGMLGLGQVFRVDEETGLYPVENRRPVRLSDIVGYDEQKRALSENTAAFVRGKRANNVLLYGDAGTGKSTSIQAIANEYASHGLRLIELYKHQFHLIPALFRKIKDRNYRFLILLDDLSFEENEVEYKYLKAVLEGGAEAAPENIRIYATSNRRHLIKETWNDRNDMEHNGDIHRSDTMEEKLSLSARFGLQLFYPNPTFDEFHNIVQALAARESAAAGMTPQQLRTAASTWQVRHGSRSGRTARQFIDSLSCTEPDEQKDER